MSLATPTGVAGAQEASKPSTQGNRVQQPPNPSEHACTIKASTRSKSAHLKPLALQRLLAGHIAVVVVGAVLVGEPRGAYLLPAIDVVAEHVLKPKQLRSTITSIMFGAGHSTSGRQRDGRLDASPVSLQPGALLGTGKMHMQRDLSQDAHQQIERVARAIRRAIKEVSQTDA